MIHGPVPVHRTPALHYTLLHCLSLKNKKKILTKNLFRFIHIISKINNQITVELMNDTETD